MLYRNGEPRARVHVLIYIYFEDSDTFSPNENLLFPHRYPITICEKQTSDQTILLRHRANEVVRTPSDFACRASLLAVHYGRPFGL